jgi:hypothetical protein
MDDTGPAKPLRPTMKEAAKENAQFPMFDPGEFARYAGRNMEVASRAARACFNGATKLNQEMIDFLNSRMRKDFESAQAFMNSKTSDEAFRAQAEFVENAFRDYAEESSKMIHYAADIAKETLRPAEHKEH